MPHRAARLAAALLLGAACARAASAQQPIARPGQARAGFGFLRGVIYDSLSRAPLDSAHVYINGTSLGTFTDQGGRFRLDSVPSGVRLLVFEHPDLDSAGLTTNVRRVEVVAGRVSVLEIAVPAFETLHRAACGVAGRASHDSGFVYGAVSDVATSTRLAGALVTVSWVTAGRGPDGRVLVSRPSAESRTDSLGNYYVCGVPTEFVTTVRATAGPFASGTTELLLGRRGLARRDIAISRDSTGVPDTAGFRSGRALIIGRVTDENEFPRPSARAALDDAASEAYADSGGRFVLRGLPQGSHTLMIRLIGYSAVRLPVRLRDGDTTYVAARLHRITVLDTIRITASSLSSQFTLDELQSRMRMGLGYFLNGEEIRRRTSMRSVVQGLPSLQIQGRTTFQWTPFTLVNGRPCQSTIYVDGIRTNSEAVQSYRPDQLIAVEWYPRGAQAPARYQPMDKAECSVLLLWTRFVR